MTVKPSLPKWIEINKEFEGQTRLEKDLIEALMILIGTLDQIANEQIADDCRFQLIAKEAMRRIEELGK